MKDEQMPTEARSDEPRASTTRWTKDRLDAWEAKVSKEIDAYLATPCKYFGPDLNY